MRYIKLWLFFLKLGFLKEAEYRINLFLHLFESSISLASGLSVLTVVFSQTDTVGGWHFNELLVVMGLWFLTAGLVNVMIAPSIREFIHDIWLGNLDYILIKPINHQFMASTRQIMVFQFADMLIGMVILITAMVRLRHGISLEHALMFVVAVLAGQIILYGFWIILGTLAIWTVKLENLMLVFYSMFEAGRWPAGLYPVWLRYALTFVVPITFAITVPSEAMLGRITVTALLWTVLAAAIVFTVSKWFFHYGVQRKYCGASA